MLAVFHLHLLCDLLGSKGPDEIWSIPCLLPFPHSWDLVWSQQWPLNSWQNVAITIGAIGYVFYQGWRSGVSPLEKRRCELTGVPRAQETGGSMLPKVHSIQTS